MEGLLRPRKTGAIQAGGAECETIDNVVFGVLTVGTEEAVSASSRAALTRSSPADHNIRKTIQSILPLAFISSGSTIPT